LWGIVAIDAPLYIEILGVVQRLDFGDDPYQDLDPGTSGGRKAKVDGPAERQLIWTPVDESP